MRRLFSTLAESCTRALLVQGDRSPLPLDGHPAESAGPALSPRRPVASRRPVQVGARAVLTAAIAASLLLPFAGHGATVASASTALPNLAERAAQSPDGLLHIGLIPGESEARYIMTIQTLGQPPKQAACTTRAVTGEIVLNPDGSVVSELSKIVVDQRTLKCAAPLRDKQAQDLLQTAQHPYAEFLVKATPGIGLPLPEGDAAFQLTGDQTVRGVTQPATYQTAAAFTPEMMIGKSQTTLPMSSFGIKAPNIGPLLQVADEMVAEVDIKAMIGAPAAAGAPAPTTDPAAGGMPAEESSEGEPGAVETPTADES